MAEALKPCCVEARDAYVARTVKSLRSYPLIKSIPCPTCSSIIPIRVYTAPSASDAA